MIKELALVLGCSPTEADLRTHLQNRYKLVQKIIRVQSEPCAEPFLFQTCPGVIAIHESKLGSVRTSMESQDLDILKLAPRISAELERIFCEIVNRRQQVVQEFDKAKQRPRMMDQKKSYREVIKAFTKNIVSLLTALFKRFLALHVIY